MDLLGAVPLVHSKWIACHLQLNTTSCWTHTTGILHVSIFPSTSSLVQPSFLSPARRCKKCAPWWNHIPLPLPLWNSDSTQRVHLLFIYSWPSLLHLILTLSSYLIYTPPALIGCSYICFPCLSSIFLVVSAALPYLYLIVAGGEGSITQ